MKTLGLVLIVLCASLIGLFFSHRLSKRVSTLEDTINLTGLLASELRYTMAPMPVIIAQAARQVAGLGFLTSCSQLCGKGVPFPSAWSSALKSAPGGLLGEDIKTLEHLGVVLGAIDLNGALSELRHAEFSLTERYKEAKIKQQKLGGLYRTLGALTGVGIVIMLV